MGCGKTRKMQGDYYSKIEDGFSAIIIKPGIDKKADADTLARDGSKRLFEVADELIPIIRQCSCGNPKIYNMRLESGIPVFDGEQIAIDGIEASYKSVCRKCYNNAKKRVLKK